jgi:hypothetical protein
MDKAEWDQIPDEQKFRDFRVEHRGNVLTGRMGVARRRPTTDRRVMAAEGAVGVRKLDARRLHPSAREEVRLAGATGAGAEESRMKTTIEGGRVVCTLSEEETRILVAADGVRAQIDAAVEKYFRFVPTEVQWIRVMDDNGRLRAEAGTLEALRAGGSI